MESSENCSTEKVRGGLLVKSAIIIIIIIIIIERSSPLHVNPCYSKLTVINFSRKSNELGPAWPVVGQHFHTFLFVFFSGTMCWMWNQFIHLEDTGGF